jgi:hypothetical protein
VTVVIYQNMLFMGKGIQKEISVVSTFLNFISESCDKERIIGDSKELNVVGCFERTWIIKCL